MLYIFLFLWVFSAILIVLEQGITRTIIYLGIFSLVTSVCFLFFSAPDVAMAEAAISTFSTIFFIVCFEKYYSLRSTPGIGNHTASSEAKKIFKTYIIPLFFIIFLILLFIFHTPHADANTFLKDQYVSMFANDIGGENVVTSIYLGYRMYDTLFEALMLLVSVIAVAHLSIFGDFSVNDGKLSDITRSTIGSFTIRAICPVILIFGIYLIANGHLTPGGGFQGGVALAAFFICRYLIYDIYDTKAEKIIRMEKIIFAAIILLPVLFIFLGVYYYYPQYRNAYLITMNALIGMKVCCGFIIIFYRYIAFEKR